MPKHISEVSSIGTVVQQWSVPEYEQYQRTPFWYVFMITIGLLLVLAGLFTGNFLFALIIILFAIILFLQSQQKPITVPFQITTEGVVVSSRFYPFSELKEFYIIYQPPEVKALYIEASSLVRARLRIPLYDQNPMEVREVHQPYLVENTEQVDEPISDRLARNWGIL